ncbi:MAG: flagellar type III secretion system pore protein FliP [Christensenellaceae bacterium]
MVLVLCVAVLGGCADAEGDAIGDDDAGPLAQLLGSRSQSLQLVGLLTILSIAPAILMMMTGFVRIILVLSFTRNAMGLQQMPPNQVLVALAIFLTFFAMSPVLTTVKEEAIDPYIAEEITFDEAMDAAEAPIREFMLRQTYKADLEMFMSFSEMEPVETLDEIPIMTIIPAFITSELKRGFQIGFFIYIPFIVIDMVVASTLMAMGMMMLPPIVISLPFKVLLFILVDGWTLTMQTLLTSFG